MGHPGIFPACFRVAIATAAAALILSAAAGCAAPGRKLKSDARPTVAPWGPGAATESDLSLCMADGTSVHYQGTLKHFLVMSSKQGGYLTWALTPAGPHIGCEVDVRACEDEAQTLNERHVLIFGRLLQRDERHLPLLVADQIIPMPECAPVPPEPRTIVTVPRSDDGEWPVAMRMNRR